MGFKNQWRLKLCRHHDATVTFYAEEDKVCYIKGTKSFRLMREKFVINRSLKISLVRYITSTSLGFSHNNWREMI